MRDLESSLSSKRRHLLVIMESQEAVLDVDSGGVAGSCSVQRSHRTIFRLVSTVGSADWRWPTTRNLYSAGDRRSHLSRLSPAQCHQKWHPPSSGTPQSTRKIRRVRLRGRLRRSGDGENVSVACCLRRSGDGENLSGAKIASGAVATAPPMLPGKPKACGDGPPVSQVAIHRPSKVAAH